MGCTATTSRFLTPCQVVLSGWCLLSSFPMLGSLGFSDLYELSQFFLIKTTWFFFFGLWDLSSQPEADPQCGVLNTESENRSVMSDSLRPHWLYSPWNSPGQNTVVGSCFLLQRILPTQGSHPGLPHCRGILYQLRHKGCPRILEWVACPFSSRYSQYRNQTGVSYIAGRFFTSWATTEAPSRKFPKNYLN